MKISFLKTTRKSLKKYCKILPRPGPVETSFTLRFVNIGVGQITFYANTYFLQPMLLQIRIFTLGN